MTKHTLPFCSEHSDRAVRPNREHKRELGSKWAAIQSIAAKIGCSGETLRKWVYQDDRDRGKGTEANRRACGSRRWSGRFANSGRSIKS